MHIAAPTVRVATPGDATAIAEVQVRSWRAAYTGIIPAPHLAAMSAAERAERHARRIAQPPARATDLVAERDANVVGWAGAGPSRDSDVDTAVTGEIYAVYADPAVWSTGVGAALMTAVLEHLGAAEFEAATLWVLERNDRARRFYERWGFHTDGRRQVIDLGDGVPEVRYLLSDLHGAAARRPGPAV